MGFDWHESVGHDRGIMMVEVYFRSICIYTNSGMHGNGEKVWK